MSLNSMLFLTAFLPVVFVADRLCGTTGKKGSIQIRNVLLLLASLVFYAWGDPAYLWLLLFSIALNYCMGLWIGAAKRWAGLSLAVGVLANLGLLGYYKYFDFFLRILNRIIGRQVFEMQNIPLPIGISFFTFGAVSYLVDLYRGLYPPEKNPVDMALYLSFFPKVSVGPIARYRDFGAQLRERSVTSEKTAEGIRRFSYGLGKKVLVANVVRRAFIYPADLL